MGHSCICRRRANERKGLMYNEQKERCEMETTSGRIEEVRQKGKRSRKRKSSPRECIDVETSGLEPGQSWSIGREGGSFLGSGGEPDGVSSLVVDGVKLSKESVT